MHVQHDEHVVFFAHCVISRTLEATHREPQPRSSTTLAGALPCATRCRLTGWLTSMACMTADSSLTTAAVCAASGLMSSGRASCATHMCEHGSIVHACLQWEVVFEGVGAADGVGQTGPADHDAASMLCGVLDTHRVLREGWQHQP